MSRLDAYGEWLRIPPDRRGADGQPLTHYDLLRLRPEEATPERVMKAAMERSAEVRNFGCTPQEEAQKWVERLRREIAEALICLSDPLKRQQYDREHLAQPEVRPKEDAQSVPPDARAAAGSAPAVAQWSEADQVVLQWLMQGAAHRRPRDAASSREDARPGRGPTPAGADGLGSEWVTRRSGAYGTHLEQWMEQVSTHRQQDRLKRSVAIVAAFTLLPTALIAIAAIVAGSGRAKVPSPDGSTAPTAQLETKSHEPPPKPSEPPPADAFLGSSPKSPLDSADAAQGAAAGEQKSQGSRPRSVILTLPDTVNEGDKVALKAQIGARVMPARRSVTIDWGDGAALEDANLTPSSAVPGAHTIEAGHVYTDNGEWEVRVDLGARTIATQTVKVRNVAPKLAVRRCEAGPRGAVRVEAAFTEPGVKDLPLVEIRWGDGAERFLKATALAASEWNVAGEHTYAKDGVYTIEITVTDKDEGSDAARRAVSVSRAGDSSGTSLDSSTQPEKSGSDKWFAVIVYNDRKVLDTAVVLGKARVQSRSNAMRRAARDKDAEVEVIETSSRKEAEVAMKTFRIPESKKSRLPRRSAS